MKIITSALAGTVATAAMALVSASPAAAQAYGRYGYDRLGGSRIAVQQCAAAAERTANRYAYGRARVTQIRDVDPRRGGFRVKGRIEVNGLGRDRYGYGWNQRHRAHDTGSFTCEVRYGQVADLDFNGLRGL